MDICFCNISEFKKGTLYRLLKDAYSFAPLFEKRCSQDWHDCDAFFYDNPHIAANCGFITAVNGEVAGFIVWDPRNIPKSAVIGHNCIATKYKGFGYSKIQINKAVERIAASGAEKISVTTNEILIPARKMYEGAGFKLVEVSPNTSATDFAGNHIEYVYTVKDI